MNKISYVDADSVYKAIREHFPYIYNYYLDACDMVACKTKADLKAMLQNDRTDALEVFDDIQAYFDKGKFPPSAAGELKYSLQSPTFKNLINYYITEYYFNNIRTIGCDDLISKFVFDKSKVSKLDDFIDIDPDSSEGSLEIMRMDKPSMYAKWCVQLVYRTFWECNEQIFTREEIKERLQEGRSQMKLLMDFCETEK